MFVQNDTYLNCSGKIVGTCGLVKPENACYVASNAKVDVWIKIGKRRSNLPRRRFVEKHPHITRT